MTEDSAQRFLKCDSSKSTWKWPDKEGAPSEIKGEQMFAGRTQLGELSLRASFFSSKTLGLIFTIEVRT